MILQRIAIRNFRGIREAVYDDLSPKLCLFYGPNESGKSTLVEALHVGLFEKAKGQAESKKSLQSWASDEPPEVEISFLDAEGRQWWVEKRFLDRPRTILQDANLTLRDEEAEERLREIFHTREPSNRGISEDDLGVWPLLWVRQGDSGRATKEALTADARDALSSTLAQRTGAVAAGSLGQVVRERVQSLYDRWWTPTGKRNKARVEADEAVEAAERQVADVEERYRAAQHAVTELQAAEARAAQLDERIREQRIVAEEAGRRSEAARRARQALEVQDKEVALRQQAAEVASQAAKQRTATVEAHAEAVRAAAAAEQAHTEAEEAWRTLAGRRAEARQVAEDAQVAARHAQRRLEQARRAAERDELAERLAHVDKQLQQAVDAEDSRRRLQEQLDGMRLKEDELDGLEQLATQRDRARDQLEAASAHVVVTALADLEVDGEALAEGQAHTRTITDPTTLTLGSLATIEIRPGVGELDQLRERLRDATDRFERRCRELDVADLAEARRIVQRRAALATELARHRQTFELLAPAGLGALREQSAKLSARLEAVEQAEEAPPPVPEAQKALEAAEKALVEAQAALTALEPRVEKTQATLGEARQQARDTRRQAEVLARQVAELTAEASLQEAEEAAQRALGEAVAARDHHRRTFEEAGGEAAERAAQDERDALAGLDRRRTELRERIVQLRAAIDEREEAGLFDALQDAQADLERAREHAARVAREAEAHRVLHEALEQAYQAMQERFAEPVRREVAEGVRILFPGSDLAIDDDGDVVGLRTGGVVETFDQLSGGAKEQFGVLVRLGIARVLAGERRLPVLLDDALVNSDATRRSRMVEVLRRASDRLQILVFTCHDEDFDRLAPPWAQEVRGRPARGA